MIDTSNLEDTMPQNHDQHVEQHFQSLQSAGMSPAQWFALIQKIIAFLATLVPAQSTPSTPTPPNTGE